MSTSMHETVTETQNEAIIGEISGLTSMKIIQLSKKIRELNASLNLERSKCVLLTKKVNEMDNELFSLRKSQQYNREGIDEDRVRNNSTLHAPSKKFELQTAELRTQIEILKRELKLAKKALELETGEVIPNLSHWLATAKIDMNGENKIHSGGWRGRQQKILSLNNRIRVLESLLNNNLMGRMINSVEQSTKVPDTYSSFSGASSVGIDLFQNMEIQNNSESCFSRSEHSYSTTLPNQTLTKLEDLQKDKEGLQENLENTKKKLFASRVRVNNLSNEIKGLKDKIYMMAQKGYNDDRLIDSLVKNNETLRSAMIELKTKIQNFEASEQQRENEFISVVTKNKTETEKLKEIISERDMKISELNEKISELNNSVSTIQNSIDQATDSRTTNQIADRPSIGDLETELESLKKLVKCLDNRFEQTIEQKIMYEQECSRLKQILSLKEDQSESAVKSKKSLMRPNRTRKSISAPIQEAKLSSSQYELHSNLDHLLSDQFVDEIINKAGLGASAAKIVSKRIRELQTVISDFHNQITILQAKSDAFHQARHHDIAFLSQIVNELRSQSVKES